MHEKSEHNSNIYLLKGAFIFQFASAAEKVQILAHRKEPYNIFWGEENI